jgi:hypothetical protein
MVPKFIRALNTLIYEVGLHYIAYECFFFLAFGGRFGRRLFLRRTLERGTGLCHSQSLPQALQRVMQAFRLRKTQKEFIRHSFVKL